MMTEQFAKITLENSIEVESLYKAEILKKTHSGLHIYSFILRQHYPIDEHNSNGTKAILSLSGRDCKPTRNPENKDRKTLMIHIEQNCARHSDIEGACKPGTVFDYAESYYGLQGVELYDRINKDLHLGLTRGKEDPELKKELEVIFVPDKEKPVSLSFFNRPMSRKQPKKAVTLLEVYELIKGDKYQWFTTFLRTSVKMNEARKYKAKSFDYVTFSGLFTKRNDEDLIEHSGLIVIKIDYVMDAEYVKNQLLNDECFDTELLFVSPNGYGIKWVVSIDLLKATHEEYHNAIRNYLIKKYELEVKKPGGDISRACYLPHDPDVFINPKHLKR